MSRRHSVLLLSLLVVAALPSQAQTSGEGAAAAPRKVPHRVPRAASPIEIDGLLDEPAWGSALRLELPYEVWPAESIPSRVETECLLTFDDSYFYVAFRAHDPEPAQIRARYSDRDTAFQDDFVGVIVDTFNDERRAFEFFINPLGIQMDLVQDDISGREDSSWDTIWDSAGRVTGDGYQVEVAIPYTSLRFQRGEGEQIWSLDLIRIYPRDKRYLLALNPRDRNVNCYLCQTSKIIGFEGAEPGANLEITPTLTGGRSDADTDDDDDGDGIGEAGDGGLETGDTDVDPGLFVSWGMTPNLTLAGTVNPDFSQVEADVARLDVDEPFALFFPEKRPFFLEGQDFFRTHQNLVHTRQVASPDWGGKLTGKEGKNTLGAFVARDEITNVIVPGAEASSTFKLDRPATDAVLRYRRDVGESSAVGGLLTTREAGTYHNYVASVDALLRLTDTDTIRLQADLSETRYPEEIVSELRLEPGQVEPDGPDPFGPGAQPEDEFRDYSLFFDYSHSTRNWWAFTFYHELGADFRADMGFQPRVNFRQAVVGSGYKWWGDPDDWYTRIEVGGDWDQTEDQDGNLIEREIEANVNFGGPRQSFFRLGPGHRTRVFNGVSFDQSYVDLFFEIRPTADLYWNLDVNLGERIDFTYVPGDGDPPARQGDRLVAETRLNLNLGRHVKLEVSHEYRELEVDRGKAFDANLSQMTAVFQFTSQIFFRTILQFSDVEFNRDVYPACFDDAGMPVDCDIEPESRDLFSQLLFSYKINPRTAVFLGYTDERFAATGEDLTQTGRTIFLKLTYAWVL